MVEKREAPNVSVAAEAGPQYSALMLSSTMTASIAALVGTLEAETLSSFDREMRVHESDLARKGLRHSSVHMLFIDRTAAETMQSAAETLLREVLDAHAAEPTRDLPARLSQLGEVLRTGIERLGVAMTRARDQRLFKLKVAGFNVKLEELPEALARLHTKMHAKMLVGATDQWNQGNQHYPQRARSGRCYPDRGSGVRKRAPEHSATVTGGGPHRVSGTGG